ncbi:MAG TPA: DUF5676 family membrane protein [Ignavibacteria bacterium]|nr:DUF5676 family membrane protein [Ignavibacteria bacterium]
MYKINIKKFGLAFGTTSGLLYLGCAILLSILGKEQTVFFFNTLLHGIDVSTIIKPTMSFGIAVIGLIESFILGWFVGVCIAAIYNFSLKN